MLSIFLTWLLLLMLTCYWASLSEELISYIPLGHEVRFGFAVLDQQMVDLPRLHRLAEACLGSTTIEFKIVIDRAYGVPFQDIAQQSLPRDFSRSVQLSLCAEYEGNSDKIKEIYYQLSLLSLPTNYASYKNYAFILEYSNYFLYSRYLYSTCYKHSLDVGCLLHNATASPLVCQSYDECARAYRSSLAQLFKVLAHNVPVEPVDTFFRVYHTFREQALNIHYLGGDTSAILDLYSRSTYKFLSPLSDPQSHLRAPSSLPLSPLPLSPTALSRRKMRVGIVAEYGGNSSPGLCLTEIFSALHSLSAHEVDWIFFDRVDLPTVFAFTMRATLSRTVLLEQEGDLRLSSETIRKEKVDILVFMTMGTEKFTYLLGHLRLAPLQIVVGIGHPISGGVGGSSIDYTILPLAMRRRGLREEEEERRGLVKGRRGGMACGYKGYECEILNFSLACDEFDRDCYDKREVVERRKGGYTEQIIWFESLSYYLLPPVELYRRKREEREVAEKILYHRTHSANKTKKQHKAVDNDSEEDTGWSNYSLSCEDINSYLLQVYFQPSLSLKAEDVGCISQSGVSYPQRILLFQLLQYLKKFHPLIDDLLINMILVDKRVRFLVPLGFRDLVLPRLINRTIGREIVIDGEWEMFFIEVPRISHALFLFLTGLSHAYLSTFPFGGGITSSEALGLCTPALAFPAGTQVLHFTLAQLRAMGLGEVLGGARNIWDYARLAVEVAESEEIGMEKVCQRLLIKSKGEDEYRDYSLLTPPPLNYGECLTFTSVRDLVCNRNEALFRPERVAEAAEEWWGLLQRLRRDILLSDKTVGG